jgi:hypothetical protein
LALGKVLLRELFEVGVGLWLWIMVTAVILMHQRRLEDLCLSLCLIALEEMPHTSTKKITV